MTIFIPSSLLIVQETFVISHTHLGLDSCYYFQNNADDNDQRGSEEGQGQSKQTGEDDGYQSYDNQANSADENAKKVFGDDLVVVKALPVQDADGEWTDEIVDIEDDDEYDEVVALFEQLKEEQE